MCVITHWLCWITLDLQPNIDPEIYVWGKSKKKRLALAPDENVHLQSKNADVYVCVCVFSSLWDDAVPPPPGPVHLPLPADVIPGCGHVLHRPPASTASMRGAGGRSGCLPAAHETAPVGLLDMAHHAVTKTDHRGRHGACFILSFCYYYYFPDPSYFLSGWHPGSNISANLAKLCTVSAASQKGERSL